MFKTATLITFLSLSLALNVYAGDNDRIDKLEEEVQELKFRLSKIESLLDSRSEEQKVVSNGKGWKSIANWRKLTTDMGYNKVKKILGRPERVDGGNVAFWHYQNDGKVTFMRGKVNSWSEPRQ